MANNNAVRPEVTERTDAELKVLAIERLGSEALSYLTDLQRMGYTASNIGQAFGVMWVLNHFRQKGVLRFKIDFLGDGALTLQGSSPDYYVDASLIDKIESLGYKLQSVGSENNDSLSVNFEGERES